MGRVDFAGADANLAGMPDVILIAGPTASGKSRLALDIARRANGAVINADSMQVYAELRVVTSRPSIDDEISLPHRLDGHVPAAVRYSVGAWLANVAPVLAEARRAGRVAIVVGGTGLYFKALTGGLAAVPPVPPEARAALQAETAGVASKALHARLAAVDPRGAAAIAPGDRARVLRALEVITTTGRPLGEWRRAPLLPPPIDPAAAGKIVLSPDRAVLHARIARRAEAMAPAGLAEVTALLRLDLDPELPAMKAIGVRELAGHIRGDTSLDETLAAIKTETHRYAKRQMTWFRGQMAGWRWIDDPAALDLDAFAA